MNIHEITYQSEHKKLIEAGRMHIEAELAERAWYQGYWTGITVALLLAAVAWFCFSR